jgi:hypothetical protein
MAISTPKPDTGIKHSLLQTYNFQDQAWNDPGNPNFLKFSHLARNCVLVGDTFYVRDKWTENWSPVAKAGVVSKLLNERGGTLAFGGTLAVITQDDIKNFLSSGIMSFPAITYAPGAGDFVIFQHQKRLNLYRDQRIAGDTDHIFVTEEFLKIIRNSLCAEPEELGLEAMLAEMHGSNPTLFRWVMHWLAARYQRPGYAPQTNLWFIGPLRGVGKGTLVSATNGVLGGSAVGKANQLDIQKGWTNSLFGHELIEWDEFKAPGGWVETSNLIKAMTGNETIQINARNVGGAMHPAVAMHIFSTNDEKPMRVEEHDRQNTFVATTEDKAWAGRAKALWDEESREFHEPNLVSGFAALLNEVEVDYKFISRPFLTQKRSELRDAFGCSVGKWVRTADRDFLENGIWGLEALHTYYRDWVKEHLHNKPEDIDEFKRKMLTGGWMKEASTTTGSRKDGSRRSVRGYRLITEGAQDVQAVIDDAGEGGVVLEVNTSEPVLDRHLSTGDNLIMLRTPVGISRPDPRLDDQRQKVGDDDVATVKRTVPPSMKDLFDRVKRNATRDR